MEAKQAFEKASKVKPLHAEFDNCLRHINAVAIEGKFSTEYVVPAESQATVINQKLRDLGYEVGQIYTTLRVSWDIKDANL